MAKGLRKISRPKGGRRFKASEDREALAETRSRPCLLRRKRCTVMRWEGVYPDKRQVFQEYMHVCAGRVEAHHPTTKARGGHDGQSVPLCAHAHRELHDMGYRAFELRWGVSFAVEQSRVWSEYQARKKASAE